MTTALTALRAGQTAEVIELTSRDPARLDRLAAYGLAPGSRLEMLQTRPALIVRVGETEISLDEEVGREVLVAAIL